MVAGFAANEVMVGICLPSDAKPLKAVEPNWSIRKLEFADSLTSIEPAALLPVNVVL
jgi:hypothetical protein